MKKLLFLLIAILLISLGAFAEEGETILYTRTPTKIYQSPDKSSEVMGMLEAYLPHVYTVVNGFAYSEAIQGYVEMSKMREIKIKPLPEKSIFFESQRSLYALPMEKADIIRELELEEELILLGSSIGYAKVKDTKGNIGYVHSVGLKEVGKEWKIRSPFNVYSRYPAAILEKPILSAKSVGNLEPYVVYTVNETSRGFVKVTAGNIVGYVELDALSVYRSSAKQLMVAYSPHRFSVQNAQGQVQQGEYTYLVKRRHGTVTDTATSAVLSGTNVQFVQINVAKPHLVKTNDTVVMYIDPQTGMELGQSIEGERFVHVLGESLNSYLIEHEGVLAFVRKSACSEVEPTLMNITMVEFLQDVSVRTQKSGEYFYKKGDFAFVFAKYNEYYELTGEDNIFVQADAIRLLGQDTPLDEKRTTLLNNAMFYAFPDTRSDAVQVEKGKSVIILAFNGQMAKLRIDGEEGYVALDAVSHYEFDYIPKVKKQYAIFLNKSKAKLSAYELLGDGSLSDSPIVEAIVAIGRSTSPTPSGVFPLGLKERWHKWTASYSPYAIEYTPARYIHGVLYESKRKDAIMSYSETYFGQRITGGCLRSPDDVAKWIYYNCESGTTTITITEE